MHAADINNATKPTPLHLAWTQKLGQEFIRQVNHHPYSAIKAKIKRNLHKHKAKKARRRWTPLRFIHRDPSIPTPHNYQSYLPTLPPMHPTQHATLETTHLTRCNWRKLTSLFFFFSYFQYQLYYSSITIFMEISRTSLLFFKNMIVFACLIVVAHAVFSEYLAPRSRCLGNCLFCDFDVLELCH